MKARILLVLALGALVVSLAALPASSLGKRPTPLAHAASPCSTHHDVALLIKEAEYPVVPPGFYTDLSYCARPFAIACGTQQFNPQHRTNVPFYRDKPFYHRCRGAYMLVKARSNPRRYSYGICGVVSWAAVIGGPWVPEATLAAKVATVIFGVSLKLSC